jgi:hypothetical protein
MTVQWPAQAVARQGKRLILPMGRGRKALCFRLDLPERIGGVSLVWHGGYELHVTVPASSAVEAPGAAQATIDLGEIHLAAVTTSTGQGLIVSGRGIRSLKRRHNKGLGQVQRKQARCIRGSRRYRALQRAKARLRARTERQVRDRRHKATRQVVRFLQQEGVGTVFIGDPHGVRDQQCGRHHNQRMRKLGIWQGQGLLSAEECTSWHPERDLLRTGYLKPVSELPAPPESQRAELGVQEPPVSICRSSRHRRQPEYAPARLWPGDGVPMVHHVSTTQPGRSSCRGTGLWEGQPVLTTVVWVCDPPQPPGSSGSLRRQVTGGQVRPEAHPLSGDRECHASITPI